MSGDDPTRPTASSNADWTQGSLSLGISAMFNGCFAALALVWMPLVLLRQVDAYVAFLTSTELLRDTALAYVLLLLPACLLAAIGESLRSLLKRLRFDAYTADCAAWSVVLFPTLWVCGWQFAGSIWAWLKTVSSVDWSIGAHGRVAASLALLGLLAWLMRRLSLGGLLAATIARLLSLRRLAQGLLTLSLVIVALHPPRVLKSTGKSGSPQHDVQAQSRPDIYLITIDTLAEGDAQVCGNGKTLMPQLRQFAQRASCFSHFYASSNFTTPSTATMETGALPWTHWAVQIVSKVARPLQGPTLATRLRDAGYETHAISTNLLASPRHHGTEGGYDTQAIAQSTSLGSKPREALTIFPDTTLPFWFSALIPFLDTIDIYLQGEQHPYAPEFAYADMLSLLDDRSSGKPKFVWVHTLPPHDPYLPPAATKYSLLPRGVLERWSEFKAMGSYSNKEQSWIDKYRLRYRESIMGADLSLGVLLKQLEARGRLNSSLIIIASDHGESFERGFLGHAGALIHNAVLQVPLVIHVPGQGEALRIETPVSLADLAPTILDLAQAQELPHADGRSLLPALRGLQMPARPVFAMAMERQSRFHTMSAGHYAIIDGDYKLVLHLAEARSELFDVRNDPQELTDLSASQPAVAADLAARLRRAIAAAEAKRSSLFPAP